MSNPPESKTRRGAGRMLLLCAATAMPALIAGPSFADSYYSRHRSLGHQHVYRDYSGYLDPQSGHYDPQFQHNRENFGFSGRDPSRPGGVDPNLNPPGRF